MKIRAYLDIETTGLSRDHSALTVVGVAVERKPGLKMYQLVGEDISELALMKVIDGVDELYTYNGSRFDLPFIKARLGIDLKQSTKHTDLMYACWKQKLKGGLKRVEQLIGIERKLKDMDGFMAVVLWWQYVNDQNAESLKTLLAYNEEDVVNLAVLREKLGVA